VAVSPAVADHLFVNRTHRDGRIDSVRVQRYVAAMTGGRWPPAALSPAVPHSSLSARRKAPLSAEITLDVRGRLTDGAHRMGAVMLAGVTVEFRLLVMLFDAEAAFGLVRGLQAMVEMGVMPRRPPPRPEGPVGRGDWSVTTPLR
jgi:hypothetical protein